jgi:large repetitive protein
MRCGLGRQWLVLAGCLLLSAGCGRGGLRQGKRDSGSAADLPPGQEDVAVLPDLRAADGLGQEASSLDGEAGSLCGNLVLDPGEDCEDGNFQAGDGCDPTCHYEPGLYAGCGNGKHDSGEGCDDGNRLSGDGCSSDCCLEACWACTDGCIVAGLRPCHCGNGMLERGEECDDGNFKAGDGCNQYCGRELGACGNGVLEKGEQCDDGNRKNGDGCDAACCYDPPSLICSTRGVCADGRVSGSEGCDDGNVLAGDGCSANCTVEPGYYCPTPGKPCLPVPTTSSCGNGQREPWEACDDGVNDGRYDGCNPDCSLGPRCGDGIVQPAYELCDEGGRNSGGYGGCRPDCWLGPYCGDGVVDPPYEECDLGTNNVPDSACNTSCGLLPRPY